MIFFFRIQTLARGRYVEASNGVVIVVSPGTSHLAVGRSPQKCIDGVFPPILLFFFGEKLKHCIEWKRTVLALIVPFLLSLRHTLGVLTLRSFEPPPLLAMWRVSLCWTSTRGSRNAQRG